MLLSLPSLSRVKSLLPTTAQGASAGCELVTSDGRALALVSATLRGEAQGGLARLVLEQRFENPYTETLKVTYRMPLPADGAISGYEFVIGERVVKGTIDKKRQARERFERALIEGRTAALLEQERADIFTQQIGNIPPREAIVARVTVDQRLVWLPEGEWEFRFPTVIGPRYIGSADTSEDVRATHIKVTDKPLPVTMQIELAIRDAIVAGAKPSSPSHLIEKRDEVIALENASRLDRDIVLRWPVATPVPGISLATARPADPLRPSSSDAYGLLTIVPPAKEAHPVAVPRDLIVLLDTSGSMSGGPLDKAKQVVAMLIDSLDERDRLELIEFSNNPRRYLTEPVVATAAAKQAAIKWVRSRVADGGTEMRAGVIEALTTLRVGAQRQVVVVTDGYVGGEHQILEALNRRLPKSCRLHVLGVGSAVNRSLATSLARAGRGVEVIVGIDEDAERGAKRLLDRTKSPMLTNVEISGSAVLRHAPAHVPDCFEGAPLVAALAIKPEGGEILVRGQLARDTWEQRITVRPIQHGDGNQAIVALYGRERVADIEANAMFESVDGEVEDLGLTFQIATRMTSWVAIDEIRRELGPSREQVVPQELPYGTTASAFGLRGAAGAVRTQAGMFQTEGSTAPDASHSIATAMRYGIGDELDADFGEEGPSETFADSSVEAPGSYAPRAYPAGPPMSGGSIPPPPRSMPPAPAVSRAPRPMASTPSEIRTQSGVAGFERKDVGDDFDSEEPTGQVGRGDEAAAEKSVVQTRTRASTLPGMTPPPPIGYPRQEELKPLQQRKEPELMQQPAPVKPGPMMAGRVAPAKPEPMMAGTVVRAKQQRLRVLWPVILALLALIALLIWWLAA
jgi:Ca-activated chloride channel homolog